MTKTTKRAPFDRPMRVDRTLTHDEICTACSQYIIREGVAPAGKTDFRLQMAVEWMEFADGTQENCFRVDIMILEPHEVEQ